MIGADTLEGGSGADTLYAHYFRFRRWVPMLNPLDDNAADVLRGDSGDDYLNSGGGARLARGRVGSRVLEAEGGDDFLDGGDGADDLRGGDGDDVLTGGPGNDAMQGGAGSDSYVFDVGDAHDYPLRCGPSIRSRSAPRSVLSEPIASGRQGPI
jgi:Ca2+-binding RTX toxin-like protein